MAGSGFAPLPSDSQSLTSYYCSTPLKMLTLTQGASYRTTITKSMKSDYYD